MSATLTVHSVNVESEAIWSFRDNAPVWRHKGSYGVAATFDPFPGYPHDMETVQDAAAHVTARVPLRWDVELYVFDREETARSNGHTNIDEGGRYGEDGKWQRGRPTGVIVLSGKRIPPHPAMTRHLVGHELGHNVEYMLEDVAGNPVHHGTVIEEYAKVRGLPESSVHHGEGGRWHDSAYEIFACDMRILVCDLEPEFWPHPGIPHPNEVDGLLDWWSGAMDRLRGAEPWTPLDERKAAHGSGTG